MRGTNVQGQVSGNGWEEKKLPADVHGRGKALCVIAGPSSQQWRLCPSLCSWEEKESQSNQEGPADPTVANHPIGTRPLVNFLPGRGSAAWLRKGPTSPSTPAILPTGLRAERSACLAHHPQFILWSITIQGEPEEAMGLKWAAACRVVCLHLVHRPILESLVPEGQKDSGDMKRRQK